MLHTFNVFSNGGELEFESEYANNPVGYIFLFLVGCVVLLLVLSQFFIAILVASWDAAAQQSREIARLYSLPEAGFRVKEHSHLEVRHAGFRAGAL